MYLFEMYNNICILHLLCSQVFSIIFEIYDWIYLYLSRSRRTIFLFYKFFFFTIIDQKCFNNLIPKYVCIDIRLVESGSVSYLNILVKVTPFAVCSMYKTFWRFIQSFLFKIHRIHIKYLNSFESIRNKK